MSILVVTPISRAIALAALATVSAAGDGSLAEHGRAWYPEHGGCSFFSASKIATHWATEGDHLRDMVKRTRETNRLIGMIPTPRAAIRSPNMRSPVGNPPSASTAACAGIDDCIQRAAEAAGVPLTYLTTDAEFLRRARLDLTGRIPTRNEVLAFLADTSSDKRARLIDRLLQTPEWADRWAMFFGDLFHNTVITEQINRYPNTRDSFHMYLLESLKANKPYDLMARELLAAEGPSDGRTYLDRYSDYAQFQATYEDYENNPVLPSPVGYLIGARMGGGPIQDTYDQMSFIVARDFLGLGVLDCVICHDGAGHLDGLSAWGERATRLESWELAAFFSDIPLLNSWRVARRTLPLDPETNRPVRANYYFLDDLAIGRRQSAGNGDLAGEYLARTQGGNRPDRLHSRRFVQPRYVLAESSPVNPNLRLREQLGIHLTNDPQFARAIVNYIWKEFFSRGIVEPADQFDLRRLDPADPPPTGWGIQPSHPRMLNWLAAGFRANGFDLKWLMKEIVSSETYQLSSRYEGMFNPTYERYFVRRQAKRLSAEMVHDSVLIASGIPTQYRVSRSIPSVQYAMQLPDVNRLLRGKAARIRNAAAFIRAFLPGDRKQNPRSFEGSPLQALQLMNNPFVLNRASSTTEEGNLAEFIDSPDEELIRNSYLTVLGRYPDESELALALGHLNTEDSDRNAGVADLVWALFNRVEFYTNY